jgi:hypothetical protein
MMFEIVLKLFFWRWRSLGIGHFFKKENLASPFVVTVSILFCDWGDETCMAWISSAWGTKSGAWMEQSGTDASVQPLV